RQRHRGAERRGHHAVSVTAGKQLYVNGIINGAGQVTLQGGADASGVSVWVAATYLTSGGNLVPDGQGNAQFQSGGQIQAGSNGTFSTTGADDVERDGIIGVTSNAGGHPTATTSAITATSTGGTVTAQGPLSARDSVTVNGVGINLLAGDIVQALLAG